MEEQKPRFEASRRKRDELAARFFAAVGDGDLDGLVELLADDVVVYGDSGGKAPSWPQPIVGADRVSRLLSGLGHQIRELGLNIQPHQINGQPGAIVFDTNGQLTNVFSLDIADGLVQTVRSVMCSTPTSFGTLGR